MTPKAETPPVVARIEALYEAMLLDDTTSERRAEVRAIIATLEEIAGEMRREAAEEDDTIKALYRAADRLAAARRGLMRLGGWQGILAARYGLPRLGGQVTPKVSERIAAEIPAYLAFKKWNRRMWEQANPEAARNIEAARAMEGSE